MICDRCKQISSLLQRCRPSESEVAEGDVGSSHPYTIASQPALRHYPTFADLRASAGLGCECCSFLMTQICDISKGDMRCGEYGFDRATYTMRPRPVVRVSTASGRGRASQLVILFEEPMNDNLEETRVEGAEEEDRLITRWSCSFSLRVDSHAPFCTIQQQYILGNSLLHEKPRSDVSLPTEMSLLATSWIDNCTRNHVDCNIFQPKVTFSPRRLINVGPQDGSQEPRLVLCDDQSLRYATLSHIWGGQIPLQLKMATLPNYLNQIPFASLPKMFKDAVVMDCLKDWAAHCTMMDKIYQHSYITLVNPDALNSSTGFFSRPLPNQEFRLPFFLPNGAPCGTVGIARSLPLPDDRPEYDADAPTRARAWIFQERLLSARILYLSTHRMYFVCVSSMRFENYEGFEDFHVFDPESVDQQSDRLKRSLGDNLKYDDRGRDVNMWRSIVMDYSEGNLTRGDDKLPALSGIAARMHRIMRCDYLAGMWRSSLLEDLIWVSCRKVPKPTYYRAPSWSWSSCDGRIVYQFEEPNDVTYNRLARILGAETTLQTDDPHGKVSDGVLCISGPVKNVRLRLRRMGGDTKISTVDDNDWQSGICSLDDLAFEEEIRQGIDKNDDVTTDVQIKQHSRELEVLLLGISWKSIKSELAITDDEDSDESCTESTAESISSFDFSVSTRSLALLRCNEDESLVYRRIGVVDHWDPSLKDCWTTNAERSTVYII